MPLENRLLTIPQVPTSPSYDAYFAWLNAVRFFATIIALAITIGFLIYGVLTPQELQTLLIVIALYALSHSLLFVVTEARWHPSHAIATGFIVDLVLTTALSLMIGGSQSIFIFIYLTIVALASTVSGRLAVATFSASCFAILLLFVFDFLLERPVNESYFLFSGTYFYIGTILLLSMNKNSSLAGMQRAQENELADRREFIIRTVHDLRSPSTTIKYAVEELQHMEKELKCADSISEPIDMIKSANEKLLSLIRDILEVGKATAPIPAAQADIINPYSLFSELQKEFSATSKRRGVSVQIECDADTEFCVADVRSLREICNNLLDNAIKYTNAGGTVTVCAQMDTKEKKLTIHVNDTGRGISTDELPHLFEPYFRSSHKDTEGTGLGLYIVHALVTKLKGEISVTSDLNKGTFFTIRIPEYVT